MRRVTASAAPIFTDQSVQLFLSDLNDLQVSIAEAHEETVAESVPGNGGNLVELVRLDLLGGLLLEVLLTLQLEAALSHNGGVLGLEVPDLPSHLSTDSDPVAPGVEGKAVD